MKEHNEAYPHSKLSNSSVVSGVATRDISPVEESAAINRISTLIDHLPGGIMVETPDRLVQHVNKKFCDLFGFDSSPEGLKGTDCKKSAQKVKQLFKSSEEFIARVEELITAGKPVSNEVLYLKDGRIFERDYVPVYVNKDQTEHMWYYRDITEQKFSEESLHIERNRLQTIIDMTSVGIGITDTEGRTLMMNSAGIEMHGFKSEPEMFPELEGYIKVFELKYLNGNLIPFKDWPISKAIKGKYVSNFEVVLTRKDCEHSRVISYSVEPILNHGEVIQYVLTMVDVTEQKRTDEAICKSEEKYRGLYNSLDEGVAINKLIYDDTGNVIDYQILEVNPAFEKQSPYKNKDAVGKLATELYQMSPEFINEWWKQHRKNEEAVHKEYQHEPTGHWFYIVTTPFRDGRFSTIFSNITARKQAEIQLQENQERLQLAVEATGIGPWDWNLKTNDVAFSPEWKKQIGYEENELKGTYEEWESRLHPDDREDVLQYVNEYISGKVSEYSVEFRLRHKNGTYRWIYTRGVKFQDEYGKPYRMIGWHVDITDRKSTEHALYENQKKIRSIFNAMNDAVFIHPLIKGGFAKLVSVNDTACERYGYTHEEFLSLTAPDIGQASATSKRKALEALKELRKNGKIIFSTIHVKKSGEEFPVEINATKILMDGAPMILAVVRDITERKKAEEAVIAAEEKLRNIVEHSTNLFYSHTPEHVLTYVSPQSKQYFDCDPEEAKVRWTEFVTDNPLNEEGFKNTQKAINTGKPQPPYELELRTITGRIKWVEVNEAPVVINNKTVAIVGSLTDITARKEAEVALLENEEKYRKIFQNGNQGFFLLADSYIDCNDSACKILKRTRDEIIGHSPVEFSPAKQPDGRSSEKAAIEYVTKARAGKSQQFYWQHQRKDGMLIDCEVRLDSLNLGGRTILLAAITDVTKRLQTEQALRESEEMSRRLAILVEQASEIIVITDVKGVIEYVNPFFEKLTAYSADEAIGQNPSILKSNVQGSQFYSNLWQTVKRGETWKGTFVNKSKDGRLYYEEGVIFPIKDDLGKITNYCKISRDVTRERELERQLHQSQKLETIGTLAGGIAHDFNNILTPILGYSDMAASTLQADDPLYHDLQQILNGALRAKDLINQILAFSRQHKTERKPLHLHLLISEALKLMRSSIPATIGIRQRIDKSCGQVFADPTQLHQVIVNLCTNAFHAMEEGGGILTIELQKVFVDPATAQLHPNLHEKDYVRLTVKDSGIGMNEKTLERIFEPFYTTKEVDKGTGLGLSVVHGIIRSHEGEIVAESESGKGSTFKVFLPVLTDVAYADERITESIAGGKESILIVDDEESVVNVLKKMLSRFGYQVEVYNNGIDALKAFRQKPDKYDVLITDLTMPDMTGLDLSELFQSIRSGFPVLLMTGYGDNLNEDIRKKYGIKKVVEKPVVMRELASAIRSVLGKYK